MRIIVILSPTNAYGTKTEYTKLRKFLISDGYIRIAMDVFERVATDRKSAQKHLRRIQRYTPSTGCIELTEKQNKKTVYLTNNEDVQESNVGNKEHICLS